MKIWIHEHCAMVVKVFPTMAEEVKC